MPSNVKKFQRCILHIGTEKTGTTSIQHYLSSHRSMLLKHGIHYPYGLDTPDTSQWEFVAVAHPNPWAQDIGRALDIADARDQKTFADSLTAKLDQELSEVGEASTLLISSEHFQSRLFNEDSIDRLKSFLTRWVDRFEVIVYFRRQDRFALSLLSTHLKSSVKLPRAPAIELMNITPRYFEYNMIYQRWMNIFGADAMTARIYHPPAFPNKNIVHDFCQALSLPVLPDNQLRFNASLSRRGFHFLNTLNEIAPETPGNRADTDRIALVQAVSKMFEGKYYPISRTEARDFYDKYAQTNEFLRGVAFPDHQGPLFDDDFSEYPEQAEPLEVDYREMVEVGVALWALKPKSSSSARVLFEKVIERFYRRGN